MRAIVFADSHIGEYLEGHIDPQTGLNTRLMDTLDVWTWIHRLAHEKKTDLVIFAGDRFRLKRPPAWVRDLADERLIPFERDNIPLFLLLGNHDMYDKAGRWNSYGGVKTWGTSGKMLVFDQPSGTDFGGVHFQFLPFGYDAKLSFTKMDKNSPNVLVFHDSVIGCSKYQNILSREGIIQEDIDRPEFALCLGGHVHLKQELNFKNTTALHIGSPLERIEDGDQGRKGALIVDFNGSDIEMEFVESPLPRIVRATHDWSGDIEAALAIPNIEYNIVQLVVTYVSSIPNGLRRELMKKIIERGAAAADVRMQSEFKLIGGEEVNIKPMPLREEAVEWVRQTTKDENLAALAAKVIQRSGK